MLALRTLVRGGLGAARPGMYARTRLPSVAGAADFATTKRQKTTDAFQPSAGPDAPKAESATGTGIPRWPAGWHDHLQYHFFFDGMFVQARVFMTPSLEEHSLWIFDHDEGKVQEFVNSSERMQQGNKEWLDLRASQLQIEDGPGGGFVKLNGNGGEELEVKFENKHVFSWLPAGQGKDAVIHRPDLDITLNFRGKTMKGRGYSKRYFGEYGPHWGYRFIQSSSLPGDRFLWTADATFRLGSGEAKYNYFKLLNGATGDLVQAESEHTYQQDCEGIGFINGKRYVARVTPLGEWMHDFKAGETNSRMQLRYCKLELDEGTGAKPLEGYALNERCFGVL